MKITTNKRHGGIERVFYDGVELDQHANILLAFPMLFRRLQSEGEFIERIIEIGSSRGGLPFVLKELSMVDFPIISYDIHRALMDKTHNQEAKEKNIDFRVKDCFEAEEEIKDLIQKDGLTILLCDGGCKPKEFKTFAKYLKSGDIIMSHDFGLNEEQYRKEIHEQGIWKMEWLSSNGEDFQETCDEEGLESFMQDIFLNAVWGIWRKK